MNSNYSQCEGLLISSISLGSYLGVPNTLVDQCLVDIVIDAVNSGITYIDTAANYRCGRSEQAIGKALSCLDAQGYDGPPIIVGTKAGFLPYIDHYPDVCDAEYFQTTFIDTGIINREWVVGDWQCYHPNYLEWQLSRSLNSLQKSSIDIFYLHNPEALLLYLDEKEFDECIRSALEWCVSKVHQGKIRYFGLSTWGGFLGISDCEKISLYHIYKIAQEVGGGRYFKFIQAPFSAGMTQALTKKTQDGPDGTIMSTLRCASLLGIHVFGSAPFLHGKLLEVHCPEELLIAFGWRNAPQTYLDFARSAPGLATSIVGTIDQSHLKELISVHRKEISQTSFKDFFTK